MAFILDCAPIVDGYAADIGYADHLGDNPLQDQLITDLAAHRTLIVDAVGAGLTLREVYREVDRLIEQQGHENRHRVYPGRVLGHRIGRVTGRLPARVAVGFGTRFLRTLGTDLVTGLARGRTPLWADGPGSDRPVAPGLWAVEPHLGFRGTGAKFEELLVVTGDPARPAHWLDDDLPHVRRWERLGLREPVSA
jgi:Xaa-Pro aminopeptidase